MRANLDGLKLQYLGTTLVYLSETTLRHYYKALDGADVDALKTAAKASGFDYGAKDGLIYFEKKDIAAAEPDSPFTLSFGGNNNYSFSALDFSKLVLDSSKPDADKIWRRLHIGATTPQTRILG